MDALPLTPPPTATPFGLNFGSYSCSATAAIPPASSNVQHSSTTTLQTKPKQSKSRNGCVTCKAKRLKCDETKPTCQQCTKRGVVCGGYKKDFKWRPFEESAVANRVVKSGRKGPKKRTSPRSTPTALPTQSALHADDSLYDLSTESTLTLSSQDILIVSADSYILTLPQTASLPFGDRMFDFDKEYLSDNASVTNSVTSQQMGDPSTVGTDEELEFLDSQPSDNNPYSYQGGVTPSLSFIEIDDGVNGVISRTENARDDWTYGSPALSSVSTSSSASSSPGDFISLFETFRRPAITIDSSEIILTHFDKNTCGIMSVKDGPTENPWRTLIWPMAQNSPALYHAISALSAFHMCHERPQIRVEGMEHMRKSIRFLAQGLSHGNINQDAALATTLVLAFSESFDRHISTGIEHLRGAKVLINQALMKFTVTGDPSWMRRFQFLYSVWVYLNVLARLTSKADNDIQTPSLYGSFQHIPEVDPLLGCAATLFPLIGRAASIGQLARGSSKNSISLIAEASELKVELENWVPEGHYMPLEDSTNDVGHCIKTAEAYRWATLLYLHQAVPELPSLKAHQLAEEVMKLLASIPISSRSCIVHIYPLLAAGCEAIGEERDWVRSRWDGMRNRLRIGNVNKAWQVTQEVWDRRDRFYIQRSTNQRIESPFMSHGSRFSSPVTDTHYSNTSNTGLLGWDSLTIAPPGSPGQRSSGSPCPDCSSRRETPASSRESSDGVHEHAFSVRGELHWVGVMTSWQWEVLLG